MGWYEFLPKLLNMSMTASLVILAVLIVRLLLKKAPKVCSYGLWAVVLFRLLCPVSFASEFSLLGALQVPVEDGAAEYIPVNIVHMENPQVTLPSLGKWTDEAAKHAEHLATDGKSGAASEGALAVEQGDIAQASTSENAGKADVQENNMQTNVVQPDKVKPQSTGMQDAMDGSEQLGADPLEFPITVGTYIWGLGAMVLVCYNLVQLWRLRDRLEIAEPLQGNIYLADHIDTAFVMGLVRPRIYLPSGLREQERDYIILHEQYHIRRCDHVVKVLSFVALCIHWFNPLVWLAFLLANKDMEMSCDEAVMKQMGRDIRAEYASSLLQFATGKRLIAGAPLAFGEGDTKARVKNVMGYKKPTFWLVLAAVLVCVVVGLCLMANPKEENHQSLPLGKTFGCGLRTYNGTGDYFNPEGELFFYITKDGHLMGKGMLHPALETRGWVDLGSLEEVKLTAKNYDYYFQNVGTYEKYEIDKIKQGSTYRYRVEKAWQVIGDEEDLLAWNYYLLYLENGTWGMVCWDAVGEYGAVKWMIDLEEIESEPVEMQVGVTYRTIDCLYMNPASSFLAIGGDNGYLYRVEEDAFVEVSKSTGKETRIEIEQWTWQEFPYTDEEWAAMYWPFERDMKVSEIYEEMLYMPLDNRDCLMKMDEQLWLVTISNDYRRDLSYLWSIYVLAPVDGSSIEESLTMQESTVVEEGAGQDSSGKSDIEIIPTSYDLTVGTTYRTSEWVEWSIFMPIAPLNGDSGYLYEVTEQEFIIRNKVYGSEEHIPVAQWGWQELPYTEDEWSILAMGNRLENIRSDYTEVLYQPLSEDWFILRVDGILLLVQMEEVREQKQMGEIFTLVPDSQRENTHFIRKEYEKYYEECPEGVYPAEAWLDAEGGLTTPFDWSERGELSLAENRVGYYIPWEAMDQVGTAELLATVVEWRHFGSYKNFNYMGDYFHSVCSRFNAMEEVLKRQDMAKALFAEYKTDTFPMLRSLGNEKEQEAYDSKAWFAIEKIATMEALLASNLAFDQMDEAMKQEVLAEALKKVEQRQSGRFQCGYKSANGEIHLSEFPSGFFAYILEQEERSGSKWYWYLVETGETELVEKLDGLSVHQCWP